MAHAEDVIDGDVEDVVKNEELRAFLTLENIKRGDFDDFNLRLMYISGIDEK